MVADQTKQELTDVVLTHCEETLTHMNQTFSYCSIMDEKAHRHFVINNVCVFPPGSAGGEQRHSRGLQPTDPHLQLHQRAGLGLPPAQPEERPAAEALRRPQVRREENRGGGLRPVDPRAGQGARVRRGQVGMCAGDWLW